MSYLQYGFNYIQNELDTLSIERSTADDYRKALRAWSRTIGDMPIKNLTEEHIREGMKTMLSCGITPRTVDKRYTVLQMICVDALRHGVIQTNPFEWVRRPRVNDNERNYLDQNERARLKNRLASMKLSPLVVSASLALYAGLRSEEICALQLADIELNNNIGWVRRAIGRDGWQTYTKEPKNRAKRDFPLSETLKNTLSSWINAGYIVAPNKNAYLLTFSDEYIHPNTLTKKWRALADVEDYQGASGKRPTFHDLRHTFATACIAGGMDVKTLQSILGHKDASMTLNVYASADRHAKLAAANIIQNAI